MTSNKYLWGVYLAILATAGFSLLSLAERYRVESRNLATELAVEMDAVETLAAAENLTASQALDRLKAKGVSALVLSEQTVDELLSDGLLQFRTGENPDELALIGDEASIRRVARGFWIRFGKAGGEKPDFNQSLNAFIVSGHSPGLVRTVDVGLDPKWVSLAREKGLRVYARGSNPLGADEETVRETIAWFAEDGTNVFLPQGDQVLGRRDNLPALREALLAHNILYASPEFAKLGGDLNFIAAEPARVVRLHSAQSAELDKLTLGDGIERYVRAGRERNMRALLIRPLAYSSPQPFAAFEDFVNRIQKRLVKEGGAIGPAKPFEAPTIPRWVFPAIGLAAAVVGMYAAFLLFSGLPMFLLSGVALVLGAAAWLPDARNWTALMAAVAFPLAAFGLLEAHRHRVVAVHLLMLTLVSLVGGLAVAGLLNDLPYYIRADQFAGVKAAHFLPILLVGAFMAMRLIDWRGALKNPITWLQGFLAIFILVALAFMFARTGNDNPAAVSGLELRLRSLLEDFLPVRPRTKEFLFGYPALIIGLGLLMRIRAGGAAYEGFKGWAVLALMVGAIALTSVVNTLCHLHTPLTVGLIRIAVGFVLGGIIGGAAWLVLKYRLPTIQDSA